MVVRNDAKVFFAGEIAKAEDVLENDKTAGWGQDFIPRTPIGQAPKRASGQRHASSGVSAGTTSYPFDEIHAKSFINLDYFESGVFAVRGFPSSSSLSVPFRDWKPHYRLRYFSKYMVVFGNPSQQVGVRAFDPYDSNTHSGVSSFYMFENNIDTVFPNPALEVSKDGTQLTFRLTYDDGQVADRASLTGLVSTWFLENDSVRLFFNRQTFSDNPTHISWAKVLVF